MAFLAASALLTVGGIGITSHASADQVQPRTNYRTDYNYQARQPARLQYQRYQVQSANYHYLRVVKNNATLWQRPYNPGVRAVGNTKDLAGTQQLVHLNWQARVNNKTRYYQIGRVGKTLGWVRANALAMPRQYVLPYRYVSQFWPSHANDACEAAALMMALSVKGKGLSTPLRNVVERIPRSTNPNYGYTNNPFKYGTGATIYPRALSKVAWNQFHIRTKNITGASKNSLIRDVKHGNPVVFEGSYRMRNTSSDHSLVLLGYKRGYFFYADPFSRDKGWKITGWVSTGNFMKIFTAKKRGARAVLVY